MSGWTSPSHLLILLLIALVFFGGNRLPEIGRSLGLGMREFKESVTGAGALTPPETPDAELGAESERAEPISSE
jgi:sec-independent protein translocase protein TatA